MRIELLNKISFLFIIFLFLLTLPSSAIAGKHQLQLIKRFYSIGTASINGTYYPVGNSIARILSKEISEIVVIAEPTAGSVANIDYLRSGQIDIALIQSDVTWQAFKGNGIYTANRFPELRVLASLYSEVLQIAVKKSSGINSLMELKDKKISVGSKESGSAVNVIQVMAAAGLKEDDYTLIYERFTKATESLKDGYVDAIYYAGGIPADGLARLATRTDIKFIEIPANVQKLLVDEYPFFSSESIPAGSYNGQIKNIPTIGLRALLVTTDRLSDNDAEKFVEVIFKNSLEIAAQNTFSTLFRFEDSLKGVEPDMLHPGANRFLTRKKAE
jgi:hypothetical protein